MRKDRSPCITTAKSWRLRRIFLVNDSLMLELKANQLVAKAHEVQLVNYLVATGIDEGLLLNFGAERLRVQEKVSTPETRASLSDLIDSFC